MKRFIPILIIPILLLALLAFSMCAYTVPETEQVVITQFGKPVGDPVTAAGLHLKLPIVQDVNRIQKRVMEWESSMDQVPTEDKLFIALDTYARWRIDKPLLFFQSLHDENSAQSRLDDILDGETRNSVANHSLIELVRTDKGRRPAQGQATTSATVPLDVKWQSIEVGRDDIAHEIYVSAKEKLAGLGIELIDIRFKRINYNKEVQKKIFERMISERTQIVEKFRSEGQGEAARIGGEKKRKISEIESEAYRKVQEIMGKADAEATNIYAKAYNQSPAAYEFYQFQKTMETYLTTLDKSTSLILSTNGDYFKFMKNVGASTAVAPTAAAPAATPKPAAGRPAEAVKPLATPPLAAPLKSATTPTTGTMLAPVR